MKGMR
jgi:hypothetical protein